MAVEFGLVQGEDQGMTNMRLAFVAGAAGAALLLTGCQKLQSRDNLNKGIGAYKAAKYSEAAKYFDEAIKLDPENPNARLYLATAYLTQWIPGAESPDNIELATKAREQFGYVLSKDPKDKVALASLASLSFNEGKSIPAGEATAAKRIEKLDEAASWNKKLIEVDSKEKVAYYSLGVITWEKWYPVLMNTRAKLSMKPDDEGPLKDKSKGKGQELAAAAKVREEMRSAHLPAVDQGIEYLKKALEADPEYDEAMAYMNLLIRERADLLDDPEEYKKQVEEADKWVQKALDTKKIKAERAEKAAAQGITQDSQ